MTSESVFVLFISLFALGTMVPFAIPCFARWFVAVRGRWSVPAQPSFRVGPGPALGPPRLLDGVSSLTFGRVCLSCSERARPLFRFVSTPSTIEPGRTAVTLKDPENFKPGRWP